MPERRFDVVVSPSDYFAGLDMTSVLKHCILSTELYSQSDVIVGPGEDVRKDHTLRWRAHPYPADRNRRQAPHSWFTEPDTAGAEMP